VREALQRLDDAGHIAYVVGGSVRDFLLSHETKDHDIATSAAPDEIHRLFPESVTVGKQFGVLKVPVGEGKPMLEIASFRKDLDYKDHRRPAGILIAGPAEDAKRRDFSINALFFDPKTSRILDTVEGVEDLRRRVIRAIGDPPERFREDALRLLRAVRFATRLGFKLDPDTAEAIRSRARLIAKVSSERIRDELTAMWTGPAPADAVRYLSELGLLPHVLPELEALRGLKQPVTYGEEKPGDVLKHTLRVLDALVRQNRARGPALAWAALLHDIGKPAAAKRSGGRNFNGHEIDGAALARRVGARLKMPGDQIDTIAALVEDHLKFKDVFQMREATLQRLIRRPHFEALLALHRADATAGDGNLVYYEFCSSRLQELQRTPADADIKLVTGEDLIQLGLQPGPRFSEILRTIEDLAMEKRLRTKEQALEYVIKHFVS
jgi:poly(A) polymerase